MKLIGGDQASHTKGSCDEQATQPPKRGNVIGNYLSFYRSWNELVSSLFSQECAKTRWRVPANEWGSVEGVSVRLKVVRLDYSDFRVMLLG